MALNYKDRKLTETSLRRATIGSFLRDARIKAGLTQAEVAAHLDYGSAQFVSNWERGLSLPPFTTFPKLASFLGVSNRAFSEAFFSHQLKQLELEKKRVQSIFKDYGRKKVSAKSR